MRPIAAAPALARAFVTTLILDFALATPAAAYRGTSCKRVIPLIAGPDRLLVVKDRQPGLLQGGAERDGRAALRPAVAEKDRFRLRPAGSRMTRCVRRVP